MNIIKSLFCKHNYKFMSNIYGDLINLFNGSRSVWKCTKCGKLQLRKDYYYEQG